MAWWQRMFGGSSRGRIVALLRRADRTVEELAAALGLTDNAVRAQLAQLEREKVVRATGVRRDGTVGKPATMYSLARGTSSLLSAAYAPLLSALLTELGERLPQRQLEALLRGAGRRLALEVPDDATFDDRVHAGAGLLVDMGADAELARTTEGYEIRSHGCIVADAVATCPAACRAVEELLSEVTGTRVRERCDRAGAPSCRFFIPRN